MNQQTDKAADGGLRTTALFATALGLMVNTERGMAEAKRRYTEDQLAIGHCMRLQREADGVSLRALSRQMKISAPYVSDLERGRRNWSPITMANYRHALDSLANAGGMARELAAQCSESPTKQNG